MKVAVAVALLAMLAVDARPVTGVPLQLLSGRDTSVSTSGQGSFASASDGQSTETSQNGSPPIQQGQGSSDNSDGTSVSTSGQGSFASASNGQTTETSQNGSGPVTSQSGNQPQQGGQSVSTNGNGTFASASNGTDTVTSENGSPAQAGSPNSPPQDPFDDSLFDDFPQLAKRVAAASVSTLGVGSSATTSDGEETISS